MLRAAPDSILGSAPGIGSARKFYPGSNVASGDLNAHNAAMSISQVFLGFLQPIALGSAAVFALLLVIHIRTPRRTPALVSRRTYR